MLGRIRLHDYRCFRREVPATLEFHEGFTSFVGPNNAGKSALVRAPYELRGAIQVVLSYLSPAGWANFNNPVHWPMSPGLYEQAELVCLRNAPFCQVDIEPSLDSEGSQSAIGRFSLKLSEDATTFRCSFFDQNFVELPPTQQFNGLSEAALEVNGSRYSLVALRRFLDVLMRVQYIGPFRNTINEGAGRHFDLQIGTSFISQWGAWRTGASRLQNSAMQRVTEDVRRLIGATSLDINATPDGKSLHIAIDGRPQKLHELGSGLSQIIVSLASALIQKPSVIMIDEPEIHLHPSLQAEFLNTLGSYASHGVMYSTHSIGLARQASDQCFTVRREGAGSVVRRYERNPHLGEFLGSLGIAGLQELGWDRILLVEGVNDVRTAQAFLRLYGKDKVTIVLPLGGDALATGRRPDELAEVIRLAGAEGKVFALVDSERTREDHEPTKVRRSFSEACERIGIKVCVTQRRALENYVTQDALDTAFGVGAYSALGPYDKAQSPFCGKRDAWQAARAMTREDLDGTDLGRFFAEL